MKTTDTRIEMWVNILTDSGLRSFGNKNEMFWCFDYCCPDCFYFEELRDLLRLSD